MDYNEEIIFHIKLKGTLDYLNCETFENVIIEAIEQDLPPFVVIELDNLQFIDIDGLESV